MALPWLQIVQLVPSILDVSRELLKKNKQPPPEARSHAPHTVPELEQRVAALEDNERKQAELVSQMAEQLAVVTKLIVELRSRLLWMTGIASVALIIAIAAVFLPQ